MMLKFRYGKFVDRKTNGKLLFDRGTFSHLQIFVYRGIQGFVKFTSFELPSIIFHLTSIHLPVANPSECTKAFLVATMKKEIRFIEAKSCGYCGVNTQLQCE